MDALYDLLVLLIVEWRFGVSILFSIILAFVLNDMFINFTSGYCVTLVVLGTVSGFFWNTRNR
jgi:hypothetical protein